MNTEYQETYTITFGDQAENHKGMQILSSESHVDRGFTLEDLQLAKEFFAKRGLQATIYDLRESGELQDKDVPAAYVLVAKNGLSALMDPDEFYREQASLEKDSKAFMYGRVVQKHARHNLCFGEQDQEPDYAQGKGRIIRFSNLPHLALTRLALPEIFGDKANKLVAEGNYYFDPKKCGIGYHGDSERRVVVGIRLGQSMDLCYQWYQGGKPKGPNMKLSLDHGDVYAMCEKATGRDWKKRTIYTLRHAAGASKFTKIKGVECAKKLDEWCVFFLHFLNKFIFCQMNVLIVGVVCQMNCYH
jgi:hypothetical protein